MTIDMNPDIMAMPRVKLVCGRDWNRFGRAFEIGAYWDANPWPRCGEIIYRKKWTIKIQFDNGQFI